MNLYVLYVLLSLYFITVMSSQCPLLDPADEHLCITHYPKAIQHIRDRLEYFKSKTSLSLKDAAELAIGTPRTSSIRIVDGNPISLNLNAQNTDNTINTYKHLFSKLPNMVITFNKLDEPRVNICPNIPDKFKDHGYFVSPTTNGDIRLQDKKYPAIFSFAIVEDCNLDILIPPIDYSNIIKFKHEKVDRNWENKQDTLYWRGSSTGMNANINNYHLNHRVKLVRFKSENDNIKINTGLTAVIHCNQDCGQMEDILRSEGSMKGRDDISQSINYKYLIDVDGNSDSIQRLPYFMAVSQSVIFRSTIFKTWYSDWLIQPWIHYIPVSTTYDDLEINLAIVHGNQEISQRIVSEAKQIADTWMTDPIPTYYLFWMLHEFGLQCQ